MTFRFAKRPAISVAFAALALVLLAALSAAPTVAQGVARDDASLAGRLLVATPVLRNTYFSQTVIYMVKHDGDGARGSS